MPLYSVTYIVTRTETYMIYSPNHKFAELEAYSLGVPVVDAHSVMDVEVLESSEVVNQPEMASV